MPFPGFNFTDKKTGFTKFYALSTPRRLPVSGEDWNLAPLVGSEEKEIIYFRMHKGRRIRGFPGGDSGKESACQCSDKR